MLTSSATRLHDARRDDRGSIAMAMLLIVIGSMFAGLLVPVLVSQTGNSQYETRRNHAFDAAHSGLSFMVGKLRDTNDGSGNGQRANLPCTTSTPLTGVVSSGGNERYKTWIYYFARDPHGHDDWIDDTSKQISCVANGGTAVVPAYAVIKSQGSDDSDGSFTSGTRTVFAIYTMKSKNTNVPGGAIYTDHSTQNLCLDAGSGQPPAGTIVTLQKCSSGIASQTWGYLTNSTLSLTSTADTASGELGLCLSAPFPHSNGEPVTLQKCSTTTTPEQQWTYGGYGANWHATTSNTRVDTYCWNAQSANTVGSSVILGGCTPTAFTFEAARSFNVESAVGPGNADAAHKFLVNYNQFGRCASVNWVTGPTPHIDPSDSNYLTFLQAYPCSPVPDGDTQDPPLNQLFNFPTVPTGQIKASGQISSTTQLNGKTYCVYSLLTDGAYPRTDQCGKLSSAATTWTFYSDTGDYATSYRIVDSAGRCLQPTDPNAPNPDLYGGQKTSKLITTTCSNSTLQKWNAPSGVLSSPITDYHEK